MLIESDTIVALSSPVGASPRGIVRLSGPQSIPILNALAEDPTPAGTYLTYDTTLNLTQNAPPNPQSAIRNPQWRLPVRIYLMRAPASYTREDIVEVHTVGVPPVLRAVLQAMLDRGARAAEPGEFTRRAFLNGRIDLAQAEAVQRIIQSQSEAELRSAVRALGGRLSTAAERLRARIADLCAWVEAGLDFSDQDIEIVAPDEVSREALLLAEEARRAARAPSGRLETEFPRVALCGPVNAGKSSLFNVFVSADRAIVAPHPGTTRDTIEAEVEWDGLRFCVVDTAGRRTTGDTVEIEAIERARRAGVEADLVLLVLDSTEPDESMREAAGELSPERLIVVRNKCDLVDASRLEAAGVLVPGVAEVATSVLTGTGLTILRRLILARLRTEVERSASGLALNARHADALRRAAEALERAADAARGDTLDLAAADLRDALDAVGEISGHVLPHEILDRIFSTFCIGK